MTNKEAMQLMLNGEKVHCGKWRCEYFYCYNKETGFFEYHQEGIPSYIVDFTTKIRSGWRVYTPPKKKVKMWQWVVKDSYGNPKTTDLFYKSKDHLSRASTFIQKNIIQRADWTEIEVDV